MSSDQMPNGLRDEMLYLCYEVLNEPGIDPKYKEGWTDGVNASFIRFWKNEEKEYNRWRPIYLVPPPVGFNNYFLCTHSPRGRVFIAYLDDKTKNLTDYAGGFLCEGTHWMPLPKGPNETT